jgi:hypothetical protein
MKELGTGPQEIGPDLEAAVIASGPPFSPKKARPRAHAWAQGTSMLSSVSQAVPLCSQTQVPLWGEPAEVSPLDGDNPRNIKEQAMSKVWK